VTSTFAGYGASLVLNHGNIQRTFRVPPEHKIALDANLSLYLHVWRNGGIEFLNFGDGPVPDGWKKPKFAWELKEDGEVPDENWKPPEGQRMDVKKREQSKEKGKESGVGEEKGKEKEKDGPKKPHVQPNAPKKKPPPPPNPTKKKRKRAQSPRPQNPSPQNPISQSCRPVQADLDRWHQPRSSEGPLKVPRLDRWSVLLNVVEPSNEYKGRS
jgi:hypothetical protein